MSSSRSGRRSTPPPIFLTGATALAIAQHLGVEGDFLEQLVTMHYYTVGLILYGYDEDEREAAMEYAGKFMHAAVGAYNKRLKEAMGG